MIGPTLLLARLRLQVARNSLWRSGIARRLLWSLLALMVAGGAVGLFLLSRGVVRALRSPRTAAFLAEARARGVAGLPEDVGGLLAALPSLALFFVLTLLLFTSFSSLLSTLYLSGDMDMLLAAPLPMRAVFLVKFFEALLPQYGLLFGGLAPALLGYGAGMGYGLAFGATGLILLALAPLLPASAAALLVMGVVRVLPARRAREIVGVLGGLLGASFYLANQFVPELAPRVGNAEALQRLLALDVPLLPSAWAGRALAAAGEGAWGTLAAFGGLFALASLLAFAACLALAERLYYGGWANLAATGGTTRRRTPAEQRYRRAGPLARLLPPPIWAILLKDLRAFPRDLRLLQQLIFPLAVSGILIFRLLSQQPDTLGTGDSTMAVGGLLATSLSFFSCLMLSNALAGTGVSAEGRSFWLLRLAPLSGWQILTSKFLLAYLPYPLVGTALLTLLAVLQGSSVAAFVSGLTLLLLVGIGATAISLGFGALFPKFDWIDPQRMWSLRTGCLAPICYTGYIALTVASAGGLPLLGSLPGLAPYALLLTALGWLLAIGLTALAFWLPLSLGARRLDTIEL